jgi:hypothetical protein
LAKEIMCVSWDGKQWLFGEFCFFFAQKIIFHFLSIRNDFFKAPTKNMLQKWTITISYKNLIPYFMDNSLVICMEKVL